MATLLKNSVPNKCDICRKTIFKTFIDGRTVTGKWAYMCPTCHKLNGVGFGIGRAQQFSLQPDGKWHKVR